MKHARHTVVITGGTGTFGTALTEFLLKRKDIDRIRILSRDELKQSEMERKYKDSRLRFFLGDVRDLPRLESAFSGADIVVHAAALKHVPACEYNPFEAVKTNILGTQNVLAACLSQGVKKAIFLSSDKAVDPINHYGATKKVAENLWLYANGMQKTKFSITRWGNIIGSRGSVIPLFQEQAKQGVLTVTHQDMTRFWIHTEDAVQFFWKKVQSMKGGEVFIPTMRSAFVSDVARTIAPRAMIRYVGVRDGEKMHETLGKDYNSNDSDRLMTKKELKAFL